MIYSSWDIEQNKLKLVILGHFLPFIFLKTPKIKIFEKWNIFLEILSFYTRATKITIIWCTVSEMQEWDWQNSLSFWAIFCPFTSPTIDPEYQNFEKKMKKMPEDIILLYIMCIIWYMVPKIEGVTDRTFEHFGSFCALSTP